MSASNGKPKLPIGNVLVYNKSFDVWQRYVKPFLENYQKENDGKYPTWDILDAEFRGKVFNDDLIKNEVVIKSKFRGWLGALIRRYRERYKDELKNPPKLNKNYLPSVAERLQERYNSIQEISNQPEEISEEEMQAILDTI